MEILDDDIVQKEVQLNFKLTKYLSIVFLIAGIIIFCIPLVMLSIYLNNPGHISGDEMILGIYVGSLVILLSFTLIKVHLVYRSIKKEEPSLVLDKLNTAYWYRNLFWGMAIFMGISSLCLASFIF